MWRVGHAADDGGEAVDGAQLGVGQGESAEQAAQRHIRAGGDIGTVPVGRSQPGRCPAKSLPGQCVGHRRRLNRDERFQALGQCIQPTGCRHRGRAAESEQRVDECDPGQHEPAAQAGLPPVCRRGKNRVLGDLGASARRRRHGNVGHRRLGDRLSAADDLQIVQWVAAVAQQHCHRLADVQHASTADGHDDVCTVLLGRVGGGPGHVDRRLTGDSDHGGRQPQPLEQQLMALGPGSGAHQRPRTGTRDERVELGHASGTEHDSPGGGELERRRCGSHRLAVHSWSVVGKRAVNFVDSRGRAIISATVSRQVA